MKSIDQFLKDKRKETRLTQQELAEKSGVALTVIRKIEQRKENLNLEKVNQVLKMFGHVLAPVSIKVLKDSEENNHLINEKSSDIL
jgi:y4mF family transcriptional regulator